MPAPMSTTPDRPLRFDGRGVIVTGAGNGLGRAYALLFARLGARVLVNDLGGSVAGEGASGTAADAVVAEIRRAGGEGAANHESVEDGVRVVEAALDAFGRVDVVVNNAGILRDAAFHHMTDAEWERVYAVHGLGAFRVTRAAWPHLRAQGYGRVLFTSSASGIYGSFGQANYAFNKLGLYGLTRTLAIEGRSKGIHVNAIAPSAGSRMMEGIVPPAIHAALKPEAVAPVAAWLCHASCPETGALFEVGAGYVGKLRWQRSRGALFSPADAYSVDDVAARWAEVVDMAGADAPESGADVYRHFLPNFTPEAVAEAIAAAGPRA